MKLKFAFLLIAGFCIALFTMGQEKYKGTLFTKLGGEITGEITLNLQGSNDELIEVITVEKTKGKGSL